MKKIFIITLTEEGKSKGTSHLDREFLRGVQPLYFPPPVPWWARELKEEGFEVRYLDDGKDEGFSDRGVESAVEARRRGQAAWILPGSFQEERDRIEAIYKSAQEEGGLEVVLRPAASCQEVSREKGEKAGQALASLVEAMARLRGPQGCPWDQKQDHKSLEPHLIEEAYEVVHALKEGDMEALCEELGDLLLQIVFHSQLAAEKKAFTMEQVVKKIHEKILRRHPHVFGEERVKDAREVSFNWSEIKLREKNEKSKFSMPAGLPALKRAQKVQSQAARYGFDWDQVEGAWEKVKEELKELEKVYKKGERDKIEEEIGDLIFAIVNVSRFLKVDPELALMATVEKFLRRMHFIEEKIEREGKDFKDYQLEDLDKFWEDAKKKGL